MHWPLTNWIIGKQPRKKREPPEAHRDPAIVHPIRALVWFGTPQSEESHGQIGFPYSFPWISWPHGLQTPIQCGSVHTFPAAPRLQSGATWIFVASVLANPGGGWKSDWCILRREWMGCWGLLGWFLLVIVDHSQKFPTFSTSKWSDEGILAPLVPFSFAFFRLGFRAWSISLALGRWNGSSAYPFLRGDPWGIQWFYDQEWLQKNCPSHPYWPGWWLKTRWFFMSPKEMNAFDSFFPVARCDYQKSTSISYLNHLICPFSWHVLGVPTNYINFAEEKPAFFPGPDIPFVGRLRLIQKLKSRNKKPMDDGEAGCSLSVHWISLDWDSPKSRTLALFFCLT